MLLVAHVTERLARAADRTDDVDVRAPPRPASHGVADVTITREMLDATPHMLAGEQLSLAPGVFVDHEDGEGVGNDVHFRGFDFEHGSGVELRVGGVPVNIPMHVQGQGYADPSFVIPEVVRAIRVIGGLFDPQQGDAAIAGSAYYELGVLDRGYRVGATYGSFHQRRLIGIVAPDGESVGTFTAVALRQTDGFGPGNRAASSASAMSQFAIEPARGYGLRVLASAYGVGATLPGVVRADDVDAGRIGYFDSYPDAVGQSVRSSRFQLGAELEHPTDAGGFLRVGAWTALTRLRLRQNFTGAIQASAVDPSSPGHGDLLETTNDEAAFGANVTLRSPRWKPTTGIGLVVESGAMIRSGVGEQARRLISPPPSLVPWDRRLDAGLRTNDLGAWVDADVALVHALRVTGGVRADGLFVSVDDRITGTHPTALGVAVSPRVSASLEAARGIELVTSYGEGFRSLDASTAARTGAPFSKVRSTEIGMRAHTRGNRFSMSLAAFETRIANELVFDAADGGLSTQGASTRRGIVLGGLATPAAWLFASASLTVNNPRYDAPRDDNYIVPNVPAVLVHGELGMRHVIARVSGQAIDGRVGLAYTLLAGRHLSDAVIADPRSVVNARVSARFRAIEIVVDAFNLLDARYPDDESLFASSWSASGAARAPSLARHISAAAPRTLLLTLLLRL